MEMSTCQYALQGSTVLRQRIESLVREAWWNASGDYAKSPAGTIPVNDIAWCVAANPTVSAAVKTWMEDEENTGRIDEAVEACVTDSDLEYIVLTVALPRLGM
jgi:hypothetical protein